MQRTLESKNYKATMWSYITLIMRVYPQEKMKGYKMKFLKQWKYNSILGPLYLITSKEGICGLYWDKQSIPFADQPEGFIKIAIKQLDEYFLGKRKDFDLKLDLEGTNFQMRVWSELQKIPYAKTHSYKELAQKIKNEKAIRAVGTANGKNPICIIIPCHRVIASNGHLAGFSGGLERKRKLLDLELMTVKKLKQVVLGNYRGE